ncbi:PqqD family protein [bacterium]|nr:PqqD family protein [bacterium]
MPTNFPLSKKLYFRNEQFISRRIADEFLLIPVANQLNGDNWLFVLNEVGARIWELIDRGRSVQQIEQLLLEEFDTTPEQLEADLLRVLDQLQELGAIEAVTE